MTADYPGQAPWPFTGGTIHRAAVHVSGDHFQLLPAEREVAAHGFEIPPAPGELLVDGREPLFGMRRDLLPRGRQ